MQTLLIRIKSKPCSTRHLRIAVIANYFTILIVLVVAVATSKPADIKHALPGTMLTLDGIDHRLYYYLAQNAYSCCREGNRSRKERPTRPNAVCYMSIPAFATKFWHRVHIKNPKSGDKIVISPLNQSTKNTTWGFPTGEIPAKLAENTPKTF